MIATKLISDTQFQKARAEMRPVRIVSDRAFVMPSSSRPHLKEWHRVEFDSAEEPHGYTCACEAGTFGQPCWAAARSLEVLLLLAANGVTLAADGDAGAGGGPAPATDDPDGAVEDAVTFDRPMPRFECRRTHKAPEPEGNAEAVLVAPIRRVGKVEKCGRFTI
ncbi:MAG TPA: hypothetical protein VGB98_00160 [Pyrinomonadaceae bacterium]|jgi:hypothetical protein